MERKLLVLGLVLTSFGWCQMKRVTVKIRKETLQAYIDDNLNQLLSEPSDASALHKEYDFIVVGSGSSGSVVASRLSENPAWNVLLIEAGGPEQFFMDIPLAAPELQHTSADWGFHASGSTTFLGRDDQKCYVPSGKVVGGSSVINYMLYTHGHYRDYDSWSPTWNYSNISKYFKKFEHLTRQPEPAPFQTSTSNTLFNVLLQDKFKYGNLNDGDNLKMSRIVGTIKNGTRLSTSRAYLHPIRNRTNFHLKKKTYATKILFDETKRAFGIEIFTQNRTLTIRARKEIIVSAGAVKTPQLLSLSGLGPEGNLLSKNITVIQDLPVGSNLQDHFAAPLFLVSMNISSVYPDPLNNGELIDKFVLTRKGALTLPAGFELNALTEPDSNGIPQVELLMATQSPIIKAFFRDSIDKHIVGPQTSKIAWLGVCTLMKPFSRGQIRLTTNNPFDKPEIDFNYLSDKRDVVTLIKGCRRYLNLIENSSLLQENGVKLIDLPVGECRGRYERFSDDYFECVLRYYGTTFYDLAGTCRMGDAGDRRSVVDARLRVIGVHGLRVVDASVIPEIPSGHLNAVAIMIGEKGADLIKHDWNYVL